jgi:hypothetical protein
MLPLKPLHGVLPIELEGTAHLLVSNANDGSQPELYWIGKLERSGPSARLVRELNAKLHAMPTTIHTYPELNPMTLKLSSKCESTKKDDTDWDWTCAYLVAFAIEAGAFKNLKRCALKECSKYFIGDPRSKWCSDNCGSKYRVRKKRRKDSQRGIL